MPELAIDRSQARKIRNDLLDFAVAPTIYSHLINVATDPLLDILEREYFRRRLIDGGGTFKYLEGYYGSGKTQFIYSLAARAWQNDIATAVVDIGIECPFNSPMAIYQNLMRSFIPPVHDVGAVPDTKGIETLVQDWIGQKLREMGVASGEPVDPELRQQLAAHFEQPVIGALDTQAFKALQRLGRSLAKVATQAGASLDDSVLQWLRGDNIRTPELQKVGIAERVNDANAFARLKTVLAFLRKNLGFKGFLIAFDEGRRLGSFKQGSTKQKQAIENMLTMINETVSGGFAGVMFLYAATPDFRSEVVAGRYAALDGRIGKMAFSPGTPMVPLIALDSLHSDEMIRQLGERLLQVFAKAQAIIWDQELQQKNMEMIMEAEKRVAFTHTILPRTFVYHYCMFLREQEQKQSAIDSETALRLAENVPPENES